MKTRSSFPLLCAIFICNFKSFVFHAWSYGESVKENIFIVFDTETLKGLWLLNKTTVLNLPEKLLLPH